MHPELADAQTFNVIGINLKIMIVLNGTFENGQFIPERELTEGERKSVTSQITNGSNNTIIYYQGDEPNEFDLNSYKTELKNKIQANTEKLIESDDAYFIWNDKTFPMDKSAKESYTNIYIAPESKFPIFIVPKIGTPFDLTFQNRESFYSAMFDRGRYIKEVGGLLKYQISQAETKEQADAVIDNRQ